jgi:hypothetical protein
MSQTCLTQAAHALHTCHSHPIHRRHTFHMHTFMNAQAYCTTCKNATSSMHIQRIHTRCMHGPHKKHSSCTHATLTCITYATYITYTSMLQACQRHTVCILSANRMPHMHACMPHSYYCMHTIVIHTAHTVPILHACTIMHACTLYLHMQATCCCMLTSCKTHVNTFHECTH